MNGTGALKTGVQGYYTYADYKAWDLDPRERYEVIHGTAYAMSAPKTNHQRISANLTADFVNFFRGKPCEVFPAPFDVRLFYAEDESDDTVVQPDLSVFCDKNQIGEEGGHGAPDFAAEILSPSNTGIEMNRKFSLYKEAGVREYWVIDPENKQIQAWNFEAQSPGKMPEGVLYKAGDTARLFIFPGLEIDTANLFAS